MRAFILLMLTLMSAQSIVAQIEAYDCEKAIRLCSKEPLIIDYLSGFGADSKEVSGTECYDKDYPETNSAWIKWKVKKGGTMEFSIIPVDEKEDFDFVLYRTDDLENACVSKESIRCTASGENLGEAEVSEGTCLGITGLKTGASGTDRQGCDAEDDNFSESVEAVEGEVYTLFINNYSSSAGFAFELKGDFEPDAVGGDCHGDISTTVNGLPSDIKVGAIFPNPSTTTVSTELDLPELSEGRVLIFNAGGQIMYDADRVFPAGTQTISADISTYPSGQYYLKIKIGENYHLSGFTKG